MPIRLEKVRHRELPIKTVLIVTAIVTCLCVVILGAVLSHIRSTEQEKEAAALWDEARTQFAHKETRGDALRTFEKLARQYKNTTYGKRARTEEIPKAKKAIVGDVYSEAETKFKDRPRDTGEAIAAIKEAAEKLKLRFPDFPLVRQQKEVRIQNVHTRHDKAARREWNEVYIEINRYCTPKRNQYGKALAAARDFAEKWPEAKKEVDAANSVATQVKQRAEKRFSEIMKQVDGLRTMDPAGAKYLLGRIIRNFGIPKYVEQAQAALDSL